VFSPFILNIVSEFLLPNSSTPTGALSHISRGSPIEKQFTFNGFTYAAQLWGDKSGLPVIALHGWLDNSGSFSALAPQLEGVQCLAIDSAGHGLSDHKLGLDDYPLWSDTAAIYAIADEMGWDTFALMGHSRGAMIALLTAGTYPKRISHLIMIDAIIPPLTESESAIARIQDSITEIKYRIQRQATLFSSRQDAITARCASRFAPVSETTAEQLAVRGLSELEGKYSWHSDSKLWSLSGVGLSQDTLQAFVCSIVNAQIPSLLLLGAQGLVKQAPDEFVAQCDALAKQLAARVDVFDDGHFLHTEKAASDVRKVIHGFLFSAHH
jgi:pimeloyl-ACP methyl ester carboxylesterase